jgi:PAS domain S-box-containing protein
MNVFKKIKTIYIILIIVLVIIIGAGIVLHRAVNDIYKASETRKEMHERLNHLEKIYGGVISAEKNHRTFLLTGKEIYLNQYYDSYENILVRLNKLKPYYNEAYEENIFFDSLESLITKKLEILEYNIDQFKKGNKNIALEYHLSEGNFAAMKKIREIDYLIQSKTYNMLEEVDKGVIDSVSATTLTILLGTIVSCAIFLSGFYMLHREIKERKKIEAEIRRTSDFSRRLLNSSIDGIIAFDKDGKITLWNPGIEALTGIRTADAVNRKIADIFPSFNELGEENNLHETLKGNYCISKDKWFHIPETGKKGYFEAYYSPIYDGLNDVVGGLSIIRNTTRRKLTLEALEKSKEVLEQRVAERTAELSKANEDLKTEVEERIKAEERIKNSLEEKVILLREIHHRVKNNLQVISSLLSLQSGYIEDQTALEIFRESQNRVRSMALIHEKLYQSKDLNKIEFSEYIESLSHDLFVSYNIDKNKIKLECRMDGIYLKIDTAILCGLIINELITNSIKHAFPGERTGQIFIDLAKGSNGNLKLSVKDDGIGFNQNFDYEKTDTLGLQLVNILSKQLGGKVELNQNGFTEFQLVFPE